MAFVTNSNSNQPRTAPDRPTNAIVATGARCGEEVRTMAKRNLYDFAEARCAKFLDMMMDYEEIMASLDNQAGAL